MKNEVLIPVLVVMAFNVTCASAQPKFEKISGQGFNEFVWISPSATSADYAAAINDVCETRDICFVRFWDDAANAGNKLPMTDSQADAMVASYARNRRVGVDKYICHPFGAIGDRCYKSR